MPSPQCMDVDGEPDREPRLGCWLRRLRAVLAVDQPKDQDSIREWMLLSSYEPGATAELVAAVAERHSQLSPDAKRMVHSTLAVCLFFSPSSQTLPRFQVPYHLASSNIEDVFSILHREMQRPGRDSSAWVCSFYL